MTRPDQRPRRKTGFIPALITPMEARVVLSHAAHPLAQAAAVAAPTSTQLSPPWYSFQSELKATVGLTPGVKVSPLVETATGYTVTIRANTQARAVALASVVTPSRSFGGVNVTVNVVGPRNQAATPVVPTSAQDLAAQETRAFAGNRLFQRAVVGHSGAFGQIPAVFPVFSKSVVQFYNDNIADLYSNTNLVAADAFGDVLNQAPGGIIVNPSTAKG